MTLSTISGVPESWSGGDATPTWAQPEHAENHRFLPIGELSTSGRIATLSRPGFGMVFLLAPWHDAGDSSDLSVTYRKRGTIPGTGHLRLIDDLASHGPRELNWEYDWPAGHPGRFIHPGVQPPFNLGSQMPPADTRTSPMRQVFISHAGALPPGLPWQMVRTGHDDEELFQAPTALTGEVSSRSSVDRLGAAILEFAQAGAYGAPVSGSIIEDVESVASWLRRNANSTYAVVASDGLLSMSSSFASGAHLFVEIDLDGSAEASVAWSRSDVRSVNVTAAADLTPQTMEEVVGSP